MSDTKLEQKFSTVSDTMPPRGLKQCAVGLNVKCKKILNTYQVGDIFQFCSLNFPALENFKILR